MLRQNEKALGTLSDNNGDANYTFTASWWNIPGTVSGEVSGSAGHVWNLSTVTIPEGPPDTTLALVGFSLALPEDREVKRLKVQLDGPSRSFLLSLQPSDNSSLGGGSYPRQGLVTLCVYSLLPGIPAPGTDGCNFSVLKRDSSGLIRSRSVSRRALQTDRGRSFWGLCANLAPRGRST